ncbi:MAG: hypothetical protein WBA64_15775 [Marinomonas sp.]|uniref:hypothetical protein n=1 Tax=Marinomonas sp. TaxID=1904862 RepID=UPI003C755134
MKLLFLIPALVSGFIYCHHYKREYYKLHRYQGQYLYLRSVAYGLGFLLVEILISLSLHSLLPDKLSFCNVVINISLLSFINNLIAPIFSASIETSFLFQTSVFVPVLAYIFAALQNTRMEKGYGRNLSLLYLYEIQDTPSDTLIANAFIDRTPLLFTLSSGKTYVGDVLEIPLPNESEKQNEEITIFPIMSGYRTAKQKIKFNTDYDLSESTAELKELGLSIALNKKDITSISNFDFDLHTYLKTSNSTSKV